MKYILLSFLLFTSFSLKASIDNCLNDTETGLVCPSSSWKLRKVIRDINYEPAVWTKYEKNKETNVLLAKMKHEKIKSLKILKRLAAWQFGHKKFFWGKEVLSKKNIVVAKVTDAQKKYLFYQGYLKNKKGQFFNLNCMSSTKKAIWKDCREVIDIIAGDGR